MNKLMTKFDYSVDTKDHGITITVTRLSDSSVKTFFIAVGNADYLCKFMNSITDDLAESYFPKPRKK